MPADATPPSDRRQDAGLAFDPTRGRLRLGTHTVTLAPGVDNRAVLVAYVEITARSRGDRVANLVEVRQRDIEALAAALDLDAGDLDAEIQGVLGASRAEALALVSRLKQSRVIGGITRAAVSP